ncbi:MAG: tetratricopeptide repeat protein [Vicinamibacterales bacterium]
MSTSRFNRVKELVLQSRDLSAAERRALLDRECAGDPDLRSDVESLLAHDSAGAGILETGHLQEHVVGAGLDDLAEDPHPAAIGPYRVVRVLGKGGMGIVYHAEQSAPIRREVAVKLIKRGMDTDRVVARFEAERQTLALMDHPHIAKVLDAGADDRGRPYFVMELVAGTSLLEFADSERLSNAERLDLFLEICGAVQHAHQRGVIHRDLKPSNILVATVDGRPRVKVIDFGIAKAVEENEAGSMMTRAGQLLGTPDFMSPEQAGLHDTPVDTRTDVYSLGVILYELLTGHRPFRFDGLSALEILRVLTEVDPARPSTAVTRCPTESDGSTTDAAVTPEAVGRARRSTAARLRRELSGDLDNIVLMAMQKEPDRRYPSVDALAEDIERYRKGLPVRARGDAWTYRTGKFIRRNRVAVAVAALVLAVVVSFGISTVVQSARVARERDRAVAAEQAATKEAETSRRVSDFMVSIFEVADPSETRGNTVTAREILDRGAARIKSDLQNEPDARATLLDAIGRVYQSLGLYASAETLLQEGLALRRQIYGEEHVKVAESLNNLAFLLQDRGRYEEARPLFEKALEQRTRLRGPDHEETSTSLYNLASLVQRLGDYGAAEEQFRKVLELDKRTLGEGHPYIALDLNNLASVVARRGDLDRAEALYRESMELNRKAVGEDHPEFATSLANLGQLLQQKGDHEGAVAMTRRALELRIKIYGETHPHVAIAMNNLGVQLASLGRLKEAEDTLRRSLAMKIETEGPRHPSTALNMAGLATVLAQEGKLDEAEDLFRKAAAINREALRPDHPDVARALLGFGRLLVQRKKYAEADTLLQRALEIWQKSLPEDREGIEKVRQALEECRTAAGA